MNPIIKAVDDVKNRIPLRILEEVFKMQNYHWKSAPVSIDEQIINKVIRHRVLVDCNLVGGTEALIPLDGLPSELVDNYCSIYHVPKDRTQGRSITAVLSVNFGSSSLYQRVGTGISNPASATPIMMAGQAMMDAMSPAPMVSTAKVALIAENTFSIRDNSPPMANSFVRCIIANDENMSHIQLRSYPAFSKLVEWAVKSYIYNELALRIDQAFLSGGQVLGRFKEIVDGYQDAETNYQDYLEKVWTKVSFMNDVESHTRFIKLQVGTYR